MHKPSTVADQRVSISPPKRGLRAARSLVHRIRAQSTFRLEIVALAILTVSLNALLAGCDELASKPTTGSQGNPQLAAKPPEQVVNRSPATQGVWVGATLSWEGGGGATSYDVYFGTSDPPDFIRNQTGATYDPPGDLNHDTLYYWRIDPRNGAGVTTGALWSFRTEPEPLSSPEQVTNRSPRKSAQGVSVGVTLSWEDSGGARSYDVYFGTSDPPDFIRNQTGATYDPPGDLNHDTLYYWRIDPRNGAGVTTGALWSFRTEPEPLSSPEQVTNRSPRKSAQGVSVGVTLSWEDSGGARSYDVYFGTSDPPDFIRNQTGATYDPPGDLNHDTLYYWRIDPRNGAGVTTGGVVVVSQQSRNFRVRL